MKILSASCFLLAAVCGLSAGPVLAQQVCVYVDANYGRGQMCLTGDVASMDGSQRNTSFWGSLGYQGAQVRDNEISSVRVPAGLKLTCWEEPNFQGASIEFTQDSPGMPDGWNDRISSMQVRPNGPPPNPNCTGPACDVLVFSSIAGPLGQSYPLGLTYRNNGNRPVRLGTRWYLGNCYPWAYIVLQPGESSTQLNAQCFPYSADY